MFKLWPQPSREIRKKEIFYSHCHIFSFFHPTLSPPLHVTRDGDISNAAVIDCTVLYCTVLYYTVLCCIVIMMLSDWTRARTRGWTRRSSPRTRWRRPLRRWQGAEIEFFNITPLNPSYTFYIHITFPVGWSHRGHGGRVCQYRQERWRPDPAVRVHRLGAGEGSWYRGWRGAWRLNRGRLKHLYFSFIAVIIVSVRMNCQCGL